MTPEETLPVEDDPRFVSVQVQTRMPWWYRRQLTQAAKEHGMNLPAYVLRLIEKSAPPKPPKR